MKASNLFAAAALAIVATFGFVASQHVGPVVAQQSKPELVFSDDGSKLDVAGDNIRRVFLAEKPPTKKHPIDIKTPSDNGVLHRWTVTPSTVEAVNKDTGWLQITKAPTGKIEAKVVYATFKIVDGQVVPKEVRRRVVVYVGEIKPGPGPDPTPPDPNPPEPDPAPINKDGLHILLVYETLDNLPKSQQEILYSAPFRDWMTSTAVDWRLWDKDIETKNAKPHWRDAMKRPMTKMPWIVVSNPGVGGFEGELPMTVEETKTLIQKYVK